MKKVEAIIRPEKIEEVKDALNDIDVKGITVTQVVGCGNQKGQKNHYRGAVVEMNFLMKMKLEIITDDNSADKVADVIEKAAKTGNIGDGKIFIYDVDKVVRIRTGESGENAI